MRRVVIILLLLAVCVAVSVYSIRHVGEVGGVVSGFVARSLAAMAEGDDTALARELDAFGAYWGREEGYLVHFVRHMGIDDITRSIARLPALAAGGDYTALSAELMSIRAQMEHLLQSERLALSNLF